MWLIVGLGNPGPTYQNTRHNVGFMALEAIQGHFSLPSFQIKGQSLVSSGSIDGHKVFMLQPQTFMNLSGKAILPLMSFYKLKPENLIVFYDDMDMDLAKCRWRLGGADGGHNGIKSIDAAIGPLYHRLKIGIGRPENKSQVTSFVLSKFTMEEQFVLQPRLQKLANFFPLFLEGKGEAYISKVLQP